MMGAGVFTGASTPTTDTDSKPGTPDSATVGMPGKSTEGFALVTASAYSFPDFTNGPPELAVGKINCTSPDINAVSPGTLPL